MRRSLLDTHVFLWFVSDDPRLPDSVRSLLEEPDHELYFSEISGFEVAIKHGLGRLPLRMRLIDLLTTELATNRIASLPLRPEHLVRYAELPFPTSGHRDPFDRILVAQSQVEGVFLITCDQAFLDYKIQPF